MITVRRHLPLVLWAARGLQRQAGRTLLVFACVAGLVFISATALLFSQALDFTWARLLDQAPDLVVRRIDGGGWAPIPAEEAVACARTVPGVIDPIPRLWGVVATPEGPVTLVTSAAGLSGGILQGIEPPVAGQAVVGQGVKSTHAGRRLILGSRRRITVDIVAAFPSDTGLATHDLVWVDASDARKLLGLAPGQASDLAVHLFRREEEQAIQADLAAAFPWPVRITDRSTCALGHHIRAVQTGGIAMVAGIPALLALILIITDTLVGSSGRRGLWQLLNALGWTHADIVRLHMTEALIVGIPAVVSGLASAYVAVFYPPAAGITAFWITGGQRLPALALNSSGAALVMLEIVALVGLPCLATVFLTSLKSVANLSRAVLQADLWN
jgi:hypothetical protein